MRIRNTLGNLSRNLYEAGRTAINYVKTRPERIAEGLTIGAAGAAVAAGIGYAKKGWDAVHQYIPTEAHESLGREISHVLSAPLSIMGIADGASAVLQTVKYRASKMANIYDYAAIPFRAFPVIAPLISYATDGNILATVGGSLAVAAVGQGLKYLGNLKRNGKAENGEKYEKQTSRLDRVNRVLGVTSIGAAGVTLATGISYAFRGWRNVIERYVPREVYTDVAREVSTAVSIPLAVMGVANGLAKARDIANGHRSKLDYASAVFKTLPALAPIVAVTTGDIVYTIGGSLVAATIGEGLNYVADIRRRRQNRGVLVRN